MFTSGDLNRTALVLKQKTPIPQGTGRLSRGTTLVDRARAILSKPAAIVSSYLAIEMPMAE